MCRGQRKPSRVTEPRCGPAPPSPQEWLHPPMAPRSRRRGNVTRAPHSLPPAPLCWRAQRQNLFERTRTRVFRHPFGKIMLILARAPGPPPSANWRRAMAPLAPPRNIEPRASKIRRSPRAPGAENTTRPFPAGPGEPRERAVPHPVCLCAAHKKKTRPARQWAPPPPFTSPKKTLGGEPKRPAPPIHLVGPHAPAVSPDAG